MSSIDTDTCCARIQCFVLLLWYLLSSKLSYKFPRRSGARPPATTFDLSAPHTPPDPCGLSA